VGLKRSNFDYDQALTLEAYRALDLHRPITDHPIGGMTDARRSAGALASSVVTEVLGYVPRPGSILDSLAAATADPLRIYLDCGTTQAARRHSASSAPMCDACKDAPKRRRPPGKTRPRRRNPGEPQGDAA
jgi:hypothetical protein